MRGHHLRKHHKTKRAHHHKAKRIHHKVKKIKVHKLRKLKSARVRYKQPHTKGASKGAEKNIQRLTGG